MDSGQHYHDALMMPEDIFLTLSGGTVASPGTDSPQALEPSGIEAPTKEDEL